MRAVATEANRGVTREVIATLPQLEDHRVLQLGVDAIDLAAARERNIPVTNTPGVMADDVADLRSGLCSHRRGNPGGRPLRARRALGARAGHARAPGDANAWACSVSRHRPRDCRPRRGVQDAGALQRPRRKPDAPYEFVADPVELARGSDFLIVACKGGPETRHLVSAP